MKRFVSYLWIALVLVLCFSFGLFKLYPKYILYSKILAGIGFVLFVICLIAQASLIIALMRSRAIKFGFNSLILTISFIAILVVINLMVDKHNVRKDLTKDKIYSLSPQTLKIIKNLKRKVKITAFCQEGTRYKQKVKDLLTEYKSNSKMIEIKFIDPDSNPSMAQKYGIRSYGTVVFESGSRRKDVEQNDIFTYTHASPYEEVTEEFKGESEFTSAILSISVETKKKVCFLEGHGEKDINNTENDGYSEVKNLLERENYDLQKTNILKEKLIPSSCNVLVIAGNSKEITVEEIKMIEEFFYKSKGSLFLLFDPLKSLEFNPFLNKFGISLKNDFIIDRASHFLFDEVSIIPNYEEHKITEDLKKGRIGLIIPMGRSLNKINEISDKVKIEPLLSTSNESWAETDLESETAKYDEGKDIKGPLTLAYAIEFNYEKNNVRKNVRKGSKGRIVIIGNSIFACNNYAKIGNLDFFVNAINWLLREEQKISIRPKSEQLEKIELSNSETKGIFYGTIIFIPGIVLIFGIVIWWKRRK